MTVIRLKAEHYAAGTSYVPVSNVDKQLVAHCLNRSFVSINSNGLERLTRYLPLRVQRALTGFLRSTPPAGLGAHFEQE